MIAEIRTFGSWVGDRMKAARTAIKQDIKTFRKRRAKRLAQREKLQAVNEPENEKALAVLKRFPIASVIMYLFLTSMFADGWRGTGFIIVAGFLGIVVATLTLRLKPVAWGLNFPIWLYMGTNNRLWLWLVLFTCISTTACMYTEPEAPAVTTAQVVAETPEAALERRVQAIKDHYAVVRSGQPIPSPAEVATKDAEVATKDKDSLANRWFAFDQRSWCSTWLWLLIVPYGITAILDEIRRATTYVADAMRKKNQVVSQSMFTQVLGSALGIDIPTSAVAGAAVATSTEAAKSAGAFMRDVAKEIMANRTAARFSRIF